MALARSVRALVNTGLKIGKQASWTPSMVIGVQRQIANHAAINLSTSFLPATQVKRENRLHILRGISAWVDHAVFNVRVKFYVTLSALKVHV